MTRSALAATAQAQELDIVPVAGRIGGEIRGVALSAALDDSTLAAIEQALVTYKVLFFRGQTHLDDAGQEAFAARLGSPVAHPTVPVRDGSGFLLELDGALGQRANSWHTDVTFVADYPRASVLRAVVVPRAGGDTLWANTAAAYAHLPPPLRDLADRLWAVHSNEYDYAAVKPHISAEQLNAYRKVFTSTVYETEHPVVRVHPVSGERALLLGHFVKRIKGYAPADSTQLFNLLQGHVTRPENTVRWRWGVGDVAIWDNRATQHYAVDDYDAQPRIVRRVTVAGDVPFSVDGTHSQTLRPT